MAKLTDKQRKFVNEYLVDLNATQAAIRAGYSEKTAYSQGQRLLKNVEIQEHLQKRQADLQNDAVTPEKVIEELAKIGFSKSTDFAINGAPIIDGAEHKTSSKLKALELIGKRFGMFDDVSATVEITDNRKAAAGLSTEELKRLAEQLTGDEK